ncbi:MAG: helix-turn-helix domain-containing protein [Longimicrobiales bacterium]
MKAAANPADDFIRAVAEMAAGIVHERLVARGPNEPSPESPYVTAEDAADLLRTSRRRVYRLVHEGRLEGVKDGSRLLMVRASIDRHLRASGEGDE